VKQAMIKLTYYTVAQGVVAGILTGLGAPRVLVTIAMGSANFWLGVWWAKQAIAHGRMQVPALKV
jgi:hypothetical protein